MNNINSNVICVMLSVIEYNNKIQKKGTPKESPK